MAYKDTVFHSRCRKVGCHYHWASSSEKLIREDAQAHVRHEPKHNVHVTSITYADIAEVSNEKAHAKV